MYICILQTVFRYEIFSVPCSRIKTISYNKYRYFSELGFSNEKMLGLKKHSVCNKNHKFEKEKLFFFIKKHPNRHYVLSKIEEKKIERFQEHNTLDT